MDYYQKIVFDKINKIHEFSDNILKNSYPLCENEDAAICSLSSVINNQAYAIKCLTEELSGILRS